MDASDQVDNVSESPKSISQDPSAVFFKETSKRVFCFFPWNNHGLNNRKQGKNKCQRLLLSPVRTVRTYTCRIVLRKESEE